MGCRCPKVTRNVSVIRSPCSCPPACQPSPPQPIQNVRPAARSGAERSPARSGDTNSKPPVDCLKSSRSSMFQLNVAALVATQFLEIPYKKGDRMDRPCVLQRTTNRRIEFNGLVQKCEQCSRSEERRVGKECRSR